MKLRIDLDMDDLTRLWAGERLSIGGIPVVADEHYDRWRFDLIGKPYVSVPPRRHWMTGSGDGTVDMVLQDGEEVTLAIPPRRTWPLTQPAVTPPS